VQAHHQPREDRRGQDGVAVFQRRMGRFRPGEGGAFLGQQAGDQVALPVFQRHAQLKLAHDVQQEGVFVGGVARGDPGWRPGRAGAGCLCPLQRRR
jgi:hypothetical protein